MSTSGEGTKCRRNVAENFNRLSRVLERYRRQTDGQATVMSVFSERSLKSGSRRPRTQLTPPPMGRDAIRTRRSYSVGEMN